MLRMNLKNFNKYTVFSILFLLGGLIHYIYWGIRYQVWYDTGIYALTIVLVLPGIIGVILSLMEEKQEEI